jgi:hypothetical protein
MGMGVRTVTSSENLAACGPSNVVLRKDIAADDYAWPFSLESSRFNVQMSAQNGATTVFESDRLLYQY